LRGDDSEDVVKEAKKKGFDPIDSNLACYLSSQSR